MRGMSFRFCGTRLHTWDGWRFEIVDLDGRRIDKVLATLTPDIRSE